MRPFLDMRATIAACLRAANLIATNGGFARTNGGSDDLRELLPIELLEPSLRAKTHASREAVAGIGKDWAGRGAASVIERTIRERAGGMA
jgi:hypothetical protein